MNAKELGKQIRAIFADIENAPNPFDLPPDPKRPSPHCACPTFFEAMDEFFAGPKKKANEKK